MFPQVTTICSASTVMNPGDEFEVKVKVEAEEQEEVEKEIMQRVSQFLNEPGECTNGNDFDTEMLDLDFDLKEEKEWVDQLDEVDQDSIVNTNSNEIITTNSSFSSEFKCSVCQKEFSTRYKWRNHLRTHVKKFRCTLCKYQASQEHNLKVHLLTHTKERPWKCSGPNCDLSFARKHSLDYHEFSRHGKKLPKYKVLRCEFCPFKTIKSNYLSAHVDTVHMRVKRFQCPQPLCPYECAKRSSLKAHIQRVHLNVRPYKCPEDGCEYAGKQSSAIKKHLKRRHQKSIEEIEAIFQNLSSSSVKTPAVKVIDSQLKLPASSNKNNKANKNIYTVNNTTNDGQEPKSKSLIIKSCTIIPLYQCNNCDFYTKEDKQLAIHLYTEHNLPRVLLQELQLNKNEDLCPSTSQKKEENEEEINQLFKFSREENVQTHESKRHVKEEYEDKELFYCSFCSYKSPRQRDVKNHVNCVHLQIKNFECELCPFKTARKTNLDRHIGEVHCRIKRMHCPHCPFKTARRPDLQRHIECIHIGLRLFKCPKSYCKYAAKDSRSLKSHLKNKNIHPS